MNLPDGETTQDGPMLSKARSGAASSRPVRQAPPAFGRGIIARLSGRDALLPARPPDRLRPRVARGQDAVIRHQGFE